MIIHNRGENEIRKEKITIVIVFLITVILVGYFGLFLSNEMPAYNLNEVTSSYLHPQRNYNALFFVFHTSSSNYSTPELIAPSNMSGFEVGDLVTFKWTSVTNATNYTLLIDLASNFSTPNLIAIRGLTKTEYTLNTSGMTYRMLYWKVIVHFKDGRETESRIQVFFVGPKRGPPPGYHSIFYLIFVLLIGIGPLLVLAVVQHYREKHIRRLQLTAISY